VPKACIENMKILYPGVDIEEETLRAKGWLINNPKKGKTYDGMTRFLGNWYTREQNENNGGGGNGNGQHNGGGGGKPDPLGSPKFNPDDLPDFARK
jgi:hypothetical protein